MKRKFNETDSSCMQDLRKLVKDNASPNARNMYLKEILAMMHSFGDVKEPMKESARLIRSILRDQMDLLLIKAFEVSIIRKSSEISHEDILFLMRKNKMKMKRLMEYLQILDMTTNFDKILQERVVQTNGKRVKMCLSFLASIEDCDEFTSIIKDQTIIDIATKRRRLRRFWMTHMMDPREYEEFSKTSQATFYPLRQFKCWLLQNLDLRVTNFAVRIIDFLARETIAEIVDMVLFMKMKKLRKNQHLLYGYFTSSAYINVKSKLNLEITDVSKEWTNGNNVNEGDYSANITINKICTKCERNSVNQMTVKKKGNFCKKSLFKDCRKKNSIKLSGDSNELNPEPNYFMSRSSRCPQQIDEERAVGDKLKYKRSGSSDIRTSSSESDVELNSASSKSHVIKDDSEISDTRLELEGTSNGTEPNSVPSDFKESPKETLSDNSYSMKKNVENGKFDLSDISDGEFVYIPENAKTGRSIDMHTNAISELSSMSETDLLSSMQDNSQSLSCNSRFSSERTFQGTSVASTSVQSYKRYSFEDISDHENFPDNTMKTCDHKKVFKKEISLNNHSKEAAQKDPFKDAPETIKLLSVVAENEVKYITPIEPKEISEAFARFQEPSRIVFLLAENYVPRSTKLICLSESLSFEIN